MAVACRGAGVRPGGVFRQRPDALPRDTAWRRDLFREWAESVWLPVAGDGCGNCHVLARDGGAGFVDTLKERGRIDRQVAGDLLTFMIGLLASDQDVGRART